MLVVRETEVAVIGAAVAVGLAAILGGGFHPMPRLFLGLLLVCLWCVAAIEWRSGLCPEEMAAVGIVVWGAFSALCMGASPLASMETLTTWTIAWALWCIARRGSPRRVRIAFRVVAMAAAVVSAAVVVASVSLGSIRVGGLLENPNVAAALLVPTLPIGTIAFDLDPRWRRWSWFAIMAAGIILTGSRAGLLAAVAVVAVMMPRGRLRLAGILAAASGAAGVLAWRFVSQPDILAWHRVAIWWAVLKTWASHPVAGVGPGCLVESAGPERILHPEQVARYQFVASYAESTPLAVLVQMGFVGLVLVVAALSLWLLSHRQDGVLASVRYRAMLASMVVVALFHDLLTVDPVLWWWAVLIGCMDSKRRNRGGLDSIPLPFGPRLVGALSMVWLTGWGLMAPAMARGIWWDGEPTREQAERVLRIEPWYPEPAGTRVQRLLGDPDPWTWETAAEALHWARIATMVQPGLARRWGDLGRTHIRVLVDLGGTDSDIEEAHRALARACELDPRVPWNWLERARLADNSGHPRVAVDLTRRALEQEPNTLRAWLFLGRLELERGRPDEAHAALVQVETRMRNLERTGLSEYDLELLEVPEFQLHYLRDRLRTRAGERP
jgi:hypothetical protein